MRMTDQGLVEAEWREPAQAGRPARHAYRLTADGYALVQDIALHDGMPAARAVLP